MRRGLIQNLLVRRQPLFFDDRKLGFYSNCSYVSPSKLSIGDIKAGVGVLKRFLKKINGYHELPGQLLYCEEQIIQKR
jgi:hypothetical protein